MQAVEGVQAVTIDLKEKTAVLELIPEVETEKLKAAVEEAGYDLKRISDL